jgi:hypothetical protein
VMRDPLGSSAIVRAILDILLYLRISQNGLSEQYYN